MLLLEVAEGHELNDISCSGLARLAPEKAVVGIQRIHVREVSITDANDDW